MINFEELGLGSISKQVNPRDIFMGLSDKDKVYQYPRDVQGEVWKQWYEVRNNRDNIIKMNTGSGKTVVALLILQSCLNEGVGPALYVVPDTYLVNQVIYQAKALGIKVTSTEKDFDYIRKKAILVINIQKLVNGKSVFGLRDENNYEIGSVVIDDIHACMDKILQQVSIKIPQGTVYDELIKLFSGSMRTQAEGRFEDIVSGNNKFGNMLVPFWEWQAKENEIYRILSNNRDEDYLLYKFGLIVDSLKLSRCYISANKIEILPQCVPIHKIASFEDAKRRIYLSATLPDDSPFSTVLDVDFDKNVSVISPEKANDIGERLIMIPSIINKDILEEEVMYKIVEMSRNYNVVVIVPSAVKAEYWKNNGAEILTSSNIESGIQKLKSQHVGLTVVLNRYDGIDLPDDSCRILVIDGLPQISNLNDIYEAEVLKKSSRLQREQVQRIEQGMGRGVRSNSDYCMIFLLGNELANMLYLEDGYQYFSNATKAQFELSEKLCEQIKDSSPEEIFEVANYILKRDKQWITISKNAVANLEYPKSANTNPLVIAFRKAFDCILARDGAKAIQIVNEEINKISDPKTKGYYMQLLAEYVNLSNGQEAQEILKSAKKINKLILNPIEGIQFNKITGKIKEQTRGVIDYINESNLDNNRYLLHVNAILDDLKFEDDSSKRFENGIANIFTVLGFSARQPESETGKGPDDFVALGNNKYLIIECKNETITETINKEDCNQLNGSYIWFKKLYQDEEVSGYPIMIHNSNVFEYACSPTEEIRIMTPDFLKKFKDNIHKFVIASCENTNFKNIERINELLNYHKLRAEDFIEQYTCKFKLKSR